MKAQTKRRRPALGSDPLDALVPEHPVPRTRRKPTPPPKVRKVRATFHLPQDLFERARDAVYWTPGLTLGSLCAAGLRAQITDLESKRGEAFPKRSGELTAGRPIKKY